MVQQRTAPLDAAFGALSDGTRRALLERLREGEASVGALARPFRMSLRGLLKHVRVLERAGLVATRKQGRTRLVRLGPDALAQATAFLDAYRELGERFDARAPYIDLSDMDVA